MVRINHQNRGLTQSKISVRPLKNQFNTPWPLLHCYTNFKHFTVRKTMYSAVFYCSQFRKHSTTASVSNWRQIRVRYLSQVKSQMCNGFSWLRDAGFEKGRNGRYLLTCRSLKLNRNPQIIVEKFRGQVSAIIPNNCLQQRIDLNGLK